MSTTTPNFGWQVPTSTDYVKDGAVAIETLGDAIDASLADLKGGTTGQVLSKATNTDMDFAWVTPDDADAIQNTIVDAKGDLIAATAADTPARLAVGTNGQVLTADSTTATGLKWASVSGGWTQIATQNLATLSTYTFSSIPNTSYLQLLLVISQPYSSAATVEMRMRVGGNTAYEYQRATMASNSTAISNATNDNSWNIGTVDQSDRNTRNITFPNCANNSTGFLVGNDNASTRVYMSALSTRYNTGLSSMTIFLDSGTWTSGTATLYGMV